jgi:hypothetical protein
MRDELATLRHYCEKYPRLPHLLGFLGFLAVYAWLLRGIHVGQLYTFGDFPPFYGTSGVEKLTDVWVDQGLGFSYIYHVLPFYLGGLTLAGDVLTSGLPVAVDGGVYAQNLLFLSFLPIGYLTFLVFGHRFVRSVMALHLGAFVYAVNPLTIGEFVNGGMAALVGYAFLPLLLHYLYAIVDTESWEATLKTGIVFGATTISPWLGFWMVGPFGAIQAYRARRSPRTLLKLVASGVIGVVLSLPSVHHMVQRALGFDGGGESVLASTLAWNYTEATPLAVARLAGNHGVMAMNRLGYNTDPAMLVGLVIPGVALLAIRRRRLHVYYGIAATIVAFMVLTKHGYTTLLFEYFPPVWSLRNPVKLQYPLLVCLSLLFGAGMESVLVGPGRRLTARDRRSSTSGRTRSSSRTILTDGGEMRSNLVVVGIVLLALLAYAAPAAGAMGLQEVRGDDYYVPQEQEELSADLNGSVMWVPYGYTSQLRLRHTYPDHVGIKSGGVLHGIQNTRYVSGVFRKFVEDPESVQTQLAQQGVKYVVVESNPPGDVAHGRPRVVDRWGAPWLWGTPENYNAMLAESDGYEEAFTRGDYTVYRVVGAEDHGRFEESTGLHRLYYPNETTAGDLDGDNAVTNGDFEAGLDSWWVWSGEEGTQSRIVETDDGQAIEMVTDGGDYYPIAQSVDVESGQPYQLDVDAEGSGQVFLYWYDGKKSPDNLVDRRSFPLNGTPATVVAKGSTVSVRIRPNVSEVRIDTVSLRRTTYPRATGLASNTESVPGTVVDGYETDQSVGVPVAVNLNDSEAAAVDAEVRIRDAETVVDAPLVYNESYRQGAGVLLSDEELDEIVPKDARAVTHDHPDGTVLDYWVVGEFDDRSVTVLYTSYDERWTATGAANSTHFQADGWANGYVGAEPDDVEWTGGQVREYVVAVWGGSWVLTLGLLCALVARRRLQDSTDSRDDTPRL